MDDVDQPPHGGMPLQKSIERFCEPDVWARYVAAQKAWEGAGRPRRLVLSQGVKPLTDDQKRKIQAKNEKQTAELALHRSILRQLKRGELVAWGREGKPTGPWAAMPSDAWDVLKPNWQNGTVRTTDGFKYYSVLIYRARTLKKKGQQGKKKGVTPRSNRKSSPGPKPKADQMFEAFKALWESRQLTSDDLKPKKGVWRDILVHLDVPTYERGFSDKTFYREVWPMIETYLKSQIPKS